MRDVCASYTGEGRQRVKAGTLIPAIRVCAPACARARVMPQEMEEDCAQRLAAVEEYCAAQRSQLQQSLSKRRLKPVKYSSEVGHLRGGCQQRAKDSGVGVEGYGLRTQGSP